MFRPVANPPNPYARYSLEWLDVPPQPELVVYEEVSKSILSENDSPDIPFRFSINPYRGCFHGCAYCYARPTHQYIDLGAGTDFERKIVVKKNAPELLVQAFERRSWQGETITFSGVTDCYQPLEGSYEITRRCLSICERYRNPVVVITKGALVRRDIDLLSSLAKNAFARVYVSIPFFEDELSKTIEPFAPRSSTRFRVIRELAEGGVPVGVAVAPVIPGLSESDLPRVLERAHECGARYAFMTVLRLPGPVEEIFLEHVRREIPSRAEKVVSALKAVKGGKLNDSRFGKRFRGTGERWEAIRWLYTSTCEKLGMNERESSPQESAFRRPSAQLSLFGP